MSITELPAGTPSRVEEKDPSVARILGLAGLIFVLAGTVMQYWNQYGNPEKQPFNPLLIRLWWTMGTGAMLFHALRDRELFARRSYGLLGYVLLVFGMLITTVHLVKLLENDLAGYAIVAVIGLLSAAVTACPFVDRANPQGESETDAPGVGELIARWLKGALSYFPRWLAAFRTNSLVQQMTFLGVAVAVLGGIVGYSVLQISSVPFGVGFMVLGFLFLLAFSSRELDMAWREAAIYAVGLGGLLAALAAGGPVFVKPYGLAVFGLPLELVLGVFAILLLGAFIGMKTSESPAGHGMAVLLFGLGSVVAIAALVRSFVPALHYDPANLRVPMGFLGVVLGGLAAALGATLAFDSRLLIMTRRELAAYFYSPIAYIVFAGMTVLAWIALALFVSAVVPSIGREPPLLAEPVLQYYYVGFVGIIVVFSVVLFLPALTMRLMSEENRSGTLEVLLTAPVNEWLVVLSKFFASWFMCMLAFLPWIVFPLMLRFVGDEQFDVRPILSFFFGMSFICSAFLAMGLLFSSLTRNQIVSFILTACGILVFMLAIFGRGLAEEHNWPAILQKLMNHMDFYHLMGELVKGTVLAQYLIFYASLAVLFLFTTVKIIEARRWR
jgi:hypothetical protein